MAWPLIRIDLDERSRDFQKIALQPGFPVLDRFAANSHVLRQWLGRFVADAVWDEQTVRFLWRDDDESEPPTVVRPAHLSDFRGPLKSEVEALQAKLKSVAPKTPNDRALLSVMQQRLDRALTGDTDIPGMFFKVRARGRWRLVWCWGYERRHANPLPLALCTQDSCRLTFFDDAQTRHRCPRCGKKVHAGRWSRIVAIVALLLMVGGGAVAWQLAGRPGLAQSMFIEGSVVDVVSGSPIPTATVHLTSDAQTTTQTNAAGHFRLALRHARAEGLEVTAPGYIPLTWKPPPSQPASEPHVIALRGAAEVTGLVVEAGTDHPIPFPAIHALQSGHRGTGDDMGLFLLPGVPSGTVEFEVSAPGYQSVRITNEQKPGRSPDLLVSLPGAATARGSVLDAIDKTPIADAVIKILDRPGESRSDDNGSFRRDGLPGTTCRFEIAAPGYFTREFERPLAPTGEKPLRPFLLRPELASLEGVVVDSSGAPISVATVRLIGIDSPTTTTAEGRFTLTGLRQGTQRVEVAAPGYPPRTVEVTAPARNNMPARIVLAGSAKLVGLVIDAVRKTPVKDAEIRLADGRWKTTSDERGRFEFAELPSGPVSVEVIGRGYRAARLESKLDSDEPVEIQLRGATVLSGTVTSTFDQQPVAGADVRLEGQPQPQKTDAEGRFRFEDVVAGAASISVSADGYRPEAAERETRTDEETRVPVVLHGAATLSGRVLSAETGQPIEQAEITIVGTDRKLTTDAKGEFSQEDWPGRPIRLKVTAKDYSPDEFDHDLSIAAIPPIVIRLKPPHTVRGVVVDARSDKPIAGAKVTLAGTTDFIASDTEGHFQFVAPQSPSYEFAVAANGYPAQSFVERPGQVETSVNVPTAKVATPEQVPPAVFKLALQRDSEQTPVMAEQPPAPPPASNQGIPAADQFGAPPPPARDPLDVEFFGIRVKAANVGFVVDHSGSMAGTRLQRTKLELLKSVLNLHPKQVFYVAFFNEGAQPMWGNESSPVLASPLNKAHTYNWMQTVPAEGGTDPQPALKMVAAMSPQSIFLLTDGGFSPLANDLYDEFQRKKIRVNTLAFEDESGKPILQEIASRTGGTYRFIPVEPIPALYEVSLVTRLFDELLEQWLDPNTAATEARESHEALVEFCKGEDFGPRPNASDTERRHARTAWRRWWVERKLTPEVAQQEEGRVRKNLDNPNLWWRWASVEALAQKGLPVAGVLIPKVRDSESGIHQATRRYLTNLAHDEDFGPPEDADPEARREAFDKWTEWHRRERYIANLKQKSDDSLVHDIDSPDVKTRRAAVRVAAERGHFTLPERLIERLADADSRVRESAHEALVKTSGKDFGPGDGADLAGSQAAAKNWHKWFNEKAEKEAEQLERLAETLEAKQRTDAAQEWYRRVIKKYPATEAATKATARLKALAP